MVINIENKNPQIFEDAPIGLRWVRFLRDTDGKITGFCSRHKTGGENKVGSWTPLLPANRNKSCLLLSSAEMFKKPLWQTVWTQIRLLLGAVWSGSTLFASFLKFVSNVRQLFAADDFSRRHFSDAFFLGTLRVKGLFLISEPRNIYCVYSKELSPSGGSFEYQNMCLNW